MTPARLVTGLITERGVIAATREAPGARRFPSARRGHRERRSGTRGGVLRRASMTSRAGSRSSPHECLGAHVDRSHRSAADGRQSQTALAVARGTTRLLHQLGFSA